MKFRAFYSDGRMPRHEITIEAPDHRAAAQQLFSQHPVSTDRRINVETQGWRDYSMQQFQASEFMDEATRASLISAPGEVPPLPDEPRASYPALRTHTAFYRIVAYIVLGVGILLVLLVLHTNVTLAIALGLYAAFVFVLLLAGGELLRVIPDIADHIRRSDELLRDIKDAMTPKT